MKAEDRAALLFALEYHDEHETLDGALARWRRIVGKLSLPPYAGGKHYGDCTKQAITCLRCMVEDTTAAAERLTPEVAWDMLEAVDPPAKQQGNEEAPR